MTKFDTVILIAIVSCFYLATFIKENGGVRQIIIETGKEIKSISKEIENEK